MFNMKYKKLPINLYILLIHFLIMLVQCIIAVKRHRGDCSLTTYHNFNKKIIHQTNKKLPSLNYATILFTEKIP